MIGFTALALGLTAGTVGALAWPLLRRDRTGSETSSQALTAAVYRDQLAELDQDLAAGSLSPEDHARGRNELQRRLLQDSAAALATAQVTTPATASAANATPGADAPRSKRLALALVGVLPVAAVGLYLAVGTPEAMVPDPPHGQHMARPDIDKMVADLAARLAKQPDDHRGWAMLGRSYKTLGRFDEAAKAYARTGPLLETRADLLVDYADSVAAAANGFTPASLALLDKALKLDPDNGQGLWMRGSAHFDAGRFAEAVTDWTRLQTLLPPEAKDAATIAANLAEARRRGGLAAPAKP